MSSENKLTAYLSDEAITYMRLHIRDAGGNEVFFLGKTQTGTADGKGVVESAQVVARGNRNLVPAITNLAHTGDVVIHNHPSGVLQPSDADAAIASQLGNEGIGFFIINNVVTEIYVVVEPQKPKEIVLLSLPHLKRQLSAEGAIARQIENFESRPQQLKMLEKVAEAFNENKIAIIEAGTGTGKTLAYLLPAIEWSVKNRERTVIATGTINLQEQLVNKDIPLLQQTLDLKFRAELVKGRNNYACKRKLAEAATQPDLFAESAQQQELQAIIEWAGKTPDGSKTDLAFIPQEQVWEKIQSESDTTLRSKCKFYHECFFYNARRRAAAADVLVANHHLLFADLSVRQEAGESSEVAVLPKYHRVILDEAHDIEEVASSYFGAATSYHGILRTLHKLYRLKEDKPTGILPFTMAKIQKSAGRLSRSLIDKFRQQIEMVCVPAVGDLESRLKDLMEQLFLWVVSRGNKGGTATGENFSEIKLRLTPAVVKDKTYQGIATRLTPKLLQEMRGCAEQILEVVKLCDIAENFIGSEAASLAVDLMAQAGRLVEMATQVKSVLLNKDEENIRWLEVKESRWGNIVRLRSAPLEVAPILRKAVFEKFPTIVLTSATLAVGKSFDYLEKSLGLSASVTGALSDSSVTYRKTATLLGSPFDFGRQALIVIPTDLPEPNARDYPQHLREGLLRALRISQGRAFILFTAYGLLNLMFRELAPELAEAGIVAMKQGQEHRHRLLENFKKQVGSVLFATDSFWQGVDVHGEALECVIIPRLPFKVPTEPVIEARVEAIDRRGGNSFMEYSVPQAVIKFKQGFGRLIRRKSDFGAIVIFDNRIVTKYYGKLFLESLPECRVVVGKSEEVFAEMAAFYKQQRGGAAKNRLHLP
ncbi:MAG: DEAD/DEAH box helicase [candidate division KSB1 bacterium]|nr:DEAD/DEAH box helicase [candidate division KSB1 bacterium]MDZ7302511.1 DEAD/DEAH box helicase [candidate division KSB1 bacterium]MDZ7311894.1 DEAD/DEAH box helicase [candidate division KSB1 bacterium]